MLGKSIPLIALTLATFIVSPILDVSGFELKPVLEDKKLIQKAAYKGVNANLVDKQFGIASIRSNRQFRRGKVKRAERAITVNGESFKYLATGALSGNSKMTVMFLHGRGGDRKMGFSDSRFNGNFKNLKALMYENNGIYISTDVTDFGDRGERNIAKLVSKYRKKTSGKLVLACGSMSSFVCWKLAKNTKVAEKIDAYVFLGGFPDPDYLSSGKLALSAGKPSFYFSHGRSDRVYNWRYASRYSRALKRRSPKYPVKLALIKRGGHGAPIKEINWHSALNWIGNQK